jgi:sugar lactone lactonase YvrE
MRELVGRTVVGGLLAIVFITGAAAQTQSSNSAPRAETSVVIAGNLSLGAGYSGDGGAATDAQLNRPCGVAADRAGNLWIADTANAVIRRVDADGKITTVNGHPILDAQGKIVGGLSHPSGIAVDRSGNVFVSDSVQNVVVKLDREGKVALVAGNLTHHGDTGNYIRATTAALLSPMGVAVDKDGNLFIADSGNGVIREVDVNGIIHTVAGNKSMGPGYSGDSGPATDAQMVTPRGVAVDNKGNLFITDPYNEAVRKVDTNGNISTVAGLSPSAPGYNPHVGGYSGDGGPAIRATLDMPEGIAVNNAGELFIADDLSDVIRKVDSAGQISTVTGDHIIPKLETTGELLQPPWIWGVAIDKDGNLVFAYDRKSVIEKVRLH